MERSCARNHCELELNIFSFMRQVNGGANLYKPFILSRKIAQKKIFLLSAPASNIKKAAIQQNQKSYLPNQLLLKPLPNFSWA
jgi:hypothetical protein